MRRTAGSFEAVAFSAATAADPFVPVPAEARWHPILDRTLDALPGGPRRFWGIPFRFRAASSPRRWIWLTRERPRVEVDLPQPIEASHLVVAHFSVPSADTRSPDTGAPTGRPLDPGQHLADYTMRTTLGIETAYPIRRRFEITDVLVGWGQLPFAARPHREVRALDAAGPHAPGEWGRNQVGAEMPLYAAIDVDTLVPNILGNYWLASLPVPPAGGQLEGLSFTLRGPSPVAIAALTFYRGSQDPLARGPLQAVSVRGRGRPRIQLDLGVVARVTSAQVPDASWSRHEAPGLGGKPSRSSNRILEFTTNDAAVLRIGRHTVAVRDLLETGAVRVEGVRIQVLQPSDHRVHVRVIDSETGRPTPARVHFRSADGRYLPPDGHAATVNDGWFEDHGADLQLGSMNYAYIDGECEVRCPNGRLYVEIVKGLEYQPLREAVDVTPTTDELDFQLRRALTWQGNGWVTADTHVHFLSPSTAQLEAAAEGVDIVNLLAAKWGDLHTNIGDFVGEPIAGDRNRAIVWVGSENRHHFLGHLSLLGVKRFVQPFSTGGPSEASLGEGTEGGYLTEWADRARREGGLVVVPHFPNPYSEVVAAAILGKIDGVEIKDFTWGIDSFGVAEWYRLLNVGLRIAAVGGTDKMSAGMPIGGVRTYAHLGSGDVSFAAFAQAVRAGRTFTTSGPLVTLEVEGAGPGEEVTIHGRARVEVRARAESIYPLGTLEVVHDGRVVAQAEAGGNRSAAMSAHLNVRSSGWIAARVSSPVRAWHCWPILLAAHTSPVYLIGGGTPIPTSDRAYLQTMLEGGIAWVDRLGQSESRASLDPLRKSFLDAGQVLAQRDR